MDIARTRKLSGLLAALSAVCICIGGVLFFTVSEVAGIVLIVAFVVVLVLCLGIRSFIRAFAFENMRRGAGKDRES